MYKSQHCGATQHIQTHHQTKQIIITVVVFCATSPGSGSRGQQPKQKQRSPDFSLPIYFVQLFCGDSEVFPSQPRDTVSPACPRSFRRASYPFLRALNTSLEASELDAKSHLIWLFNTEEQRLYSCGSADSLLASLMKLTRPHYLQRPETKS